MPPAQPVPLPSPAVSVAGTPPLAVTRLTVTRFRSYAAARLEVDARPVVLTGPNGAGKTNLLEAVSFLAPGRGLRRARLSEVERIQAPGQPPAEGEWQGGGWAVAARVLTPSGPVEIGTGRDPTTTEGERRLVRIDGAPAKSQMALADHVSVVWLTPQMDRLFVEGASGRRRFLDRLVFGFDPAHAGRLSKYENALRERARLLRDRVGEPAWLAALEDQMATTGIAIAAARADTVRRLTGAAAQGVGPFPAPGLSLTGEVDGWIATMPALAAEDRLRAALRDGRGRDAAAGTTLIGPHRSDLSVTYLAKNLPAELGSTGEQKALLIAIVLANARLMQAETGTAPLLLLDEVAAHLDPTRRTALFAEVLSTRSQAWLTGTDAGFFTELGTTANHITVADGHLTPTAPGRSG